MSIIGTTTKAKVGLKAARMAARSPKLLLRGGKVALPVAKLSIPAARLSLKVARPLARRKARKRAEQLSATAETVARAVVLYGPRFAYEFGLVEAPKPRRTAPRVAAGVVMGAGAMYLLEPGHGREHREQLVSRLVS